MNEHTTHRRAAAGLLLLLLSVAGCSSEGAERMIDEPRAGEHDESQEEGQETTVVLTDGGFQTAGIEVVEVQPAPPGIATGVAVPAQVEFDPARLALVSPRTSGRIERLTAVEGQAVRADQPVAYLLSPAFLTAQDDYLQALRRSERLAGTQDEEGARAVAAAGRRRLQLLGAPPALIAELSASREPQDLLPITAPFAGTIVEAYALAGAAVEPGSPVFKLADLSVVHVVADVPERSLPSLRQGQEVTVRLAAYPEATHTGRIERIRESVDPSTRTVKAVIEVPNPRGILRPGMFATAELHVPLTQASSSAGPGVVTIPAGALITEGDHQYVFVETGLRTYERRTVEASLIAAVGSFASGYLLVRSGLVPGEQVVTRGAFTLKSELGKHAFADDDH